MSAFYLTIDDGPSSGAQEKLAFLSERGITAIWFLLGKNIEQNKEAAVEAIRKGHILGNHSYSHPYFPLTAMGTIRKEILKTETLIEEVYELAGMRRPARLLRFPYGARGGLIKRWKLNSLLKELDFQSGPFATTQFDVLFRNKPSDRYWAWSYDTRDWALKVKGIRKLSFDQISQNLDRYLESYSPDKDQILLMHDQEGTTQEFCKLVDQFLNRGITFAPAYQVIDRMGVIG